MEPTVLTGSSVEKILKEFSQAKKIELDDIKYEVIEEGKSGFLGFFGAKKAEIKITSFGSKQEVHDFLTELIDKMGVEFVDIETEEKEDSFNFHVVGSSDAGFLIGKEGRFLNNMQYLVNRIFEGREGFKRIYLDVDDYKDRQAQHIIRKYEPVLDKVVSNQKPYTLEPLDPSVRRVIHKYIEDRPEISTLTIGDGKKKRIVVFPQGYDQTKIRKRSYMPPNRRKGNYPKPNVKRKPQRVATAEDKKPPKKSTFKSRKRNYRKPKQNQGKETE